MRNLITTIVGCCLVSVSAAAEFNPFDGPKPIAVFIQSNVWLDVIGSDTPRVAIYENGEVIFKRVAKGRLEYRRARLDKDALANMRERLKPVLALQGRKQDYNIAGDYTDLPEAMFYLRDGEREVATNVYGLRCPDAAHPAGSKILDGESVVAPPDELFALHKWFCNFDFAQSEEWKPRYIEVMLWEYSYAPDPSIQWPNDWPALDSDRAVKRGDVYSIFLDGSLLPKLRQWLATQKERGAVELAGKKWAIAYRFAYPSEPIWRKAFNTGGN